MSLSKKLKKILFEKEITPTQLAKSVSMSVPTIHRIVTGKVQKPHLSSIEDIAKYLEISVEELLDEDDLKKEIKVHKNVYHIPLLSWEIDLLNSQDIKSEYTILATNVSEKSFALEMLDYSMEPAVEKGSILIFDPTIKVHDRNYALVKLSNPGTFVLRQILIDLSNSFIRSFNKEIGDQNVKLLSNKDKIIAKLVEIRKKM